ERMRQLAVRGGPYTPGEKKALLDYCEGDVDALVRLLPRMLPHIDLPRAALRGDFVKAAAEAEHNGTPIDTEALGLLGAHWDGIQRDMVRAVDRGFGVYEGTHFRAALFAAYLARQGIPWPVRKTGELELNDEVFKEMARAYPALQPLRQLRQAL